MQNDNLESISIDDAIAIFIVSREAQSASPGTVTYYHQKLAAFVDWCAQNQVVTVNAITSHHVRSCIVALQKRNLSPYTVHGVARAIKAFLRFCVDDELITRCPKFKMPPLPKDVLPAFTRDEIARLLAACESHRDKTIVLVLLDTGMRASEFVGVNVEDVDTNTNSIHVVKGKGGKSRYTYLGAQTKKALMRYLIFTKPTGKQPLWTSLTTGERLTGDGLRQMLQRLGKRAGVEDCHPHKFRRTCAIESLRAGMNIYALQELLGHADLQVLRRYLDIVESDLRQAHSAHGAVDSILSSTKRKGTGRP